MVMATEPSNQHPMESSCPRPNCFHTVPEAAELLRVCPATLYRAIRESAFPAVRIQSRYVVPARAIEKLIDTAIELDGCVDLNQMIAGRRVERELARAHAGRL